MKTEEILWYEAKEMKKSERKDKQFEEKREDI